MESTASPHAPCKALTAGVAEAWSLCTVTLESKARHPASLLFKVCEWGGGHRTWRGRGLQGRRGALEQASRTTTGVAEHRWSREAVPAHPDGLGAVAAGFPGSGGENFSFPPNHSSSQPLPIEAAVSLDARSGHHLSATPALSMGARSTPRAHNLSTLSVAWASFPESKSLEILGRPNRERKPVSLEKKPRLW